MPSVTILHAALFTAGALVGGGVATAVGVHRRKRELTSSPVQPGGTTQINDLVLFSPVLKHGNPGALETEPSTIHPRAIFCRTDIGHASPEGLRRRVRPSA